MDKMLSLLKANRAGQSSSKSAEAKMSSDKGKSAEDILCSKKRQISTNPIDDVEESNTIELLKDKRENVGHIS